MPVSESSISSIAVPITVVTVGMAIIRRTISGTAQANISISDVDVISDEVLVRDSGMISVIRDKRNLGTDISISDVVMTDTNIANTGIVVSDTEIADARIVVGRTKSHI